MRFGEIDIGAIFVFSMLPLLACFTCVNFLSLAEWTCAVAFYITGEFACLSILAYRFQGLHAFDKIQYVLTRYVLTRYVAVCRAMISGGEM